MGLKHPAARNSLWSPDHTVGPRGRPAPYDSLAEAPRRFYARSHALHTFAVCVLCYRAGRDLRGDREGILLSEVILSCL